MISMQTHHCTALPGGALRSSVIALQVPRLHGIKRQRMHCKLVVRAFGSGKKDQAMIQGYVEPTPPPNQILSSPWYIKVPVALFGLIAVVRILKAIANRDRG